MVTIRKVLRAGHPLVRQSAREVSDEELSSSDISDLLEDMLETMRDHHGVGLAAPQVQAGLRLLVYEIDANERYPQVEESIGPKTLINPTIVARSAEMVTDWEGCLSLPDLRARVPRHQWVRVEALDAEGDKRTFRAEGFEARVIQHEMDHLDGRLLIDRVEDTQSFSFVEEYQRYHAGRAE